MAHNLVAQYAIYKPSVTTLFAAIFYVLRYPHVSTRGNYRVSVIKKYSEKIIYIQIKTHIKIKHLIL